VSILSELVFYTANTAVNSAGPLILIVGGGAVISRRIGDGNNALVHSEINQVIQSICFKGPAEACLLN